MTGPRFDHDRWETDAAHKRGSGFDVEKYNKEEKKNQHVNVNKKQENLTKANFK